MFRPNRGDSSELRGALPSAYVCCASFRRLSSLTHEHNLTRLVATVDQVYGLSSDGAGDQTVGSAPLQPEASTASVSGAALRASSEHTELAAAEILMQAPGLSDTSNLSGESSAETSDDSFDAIPEVPTLSHRLSMVSSVNSTSAPRAALSASVPVQTISPSAMLSGKSSCTPGLKSQFDSADAFSSGLYKVFIHKKLKCFIFFLS